MPLLTTIKQLIAGAILLLISQVAQADEVHEILKDAATAYTDGHYSLSIERLAQASNLIKDVQAASIVQYFPKPLDGWKIVETGDNNSASPILHIELAIVSTVIRRYKKHPDDGVSKNVLASKESKKTKDNAPWVQFTLIQRPNSLITMGFQGLHALRIKNPDAKKVVVDEYQGVLFCDKKKFVCDAFFNLNAKLMLMVNAENAAENDVKAYIEAFDIAGLIQAN